MRTSVRRMSSPSRTTFSSTCSPTFLASLDRVKGSDYVAERISGSGGSAGGERVPLPNERGEHLDADWVELAAGAAAQLGDRVIHAHRLTVGAVARHRIEGIGGEQDARRERDGLRPESLGVARPVDVLVRVVNPGHDRLEPVDPGHDLGPRLRMRLHLLVLLVGEGAGLAEDA